MARRKLIAANWKMNKTLSETEAFVSTLKDSLGKLAGTDIVIFPPFPSLASAARLLRGSAVAVGAQDVFWEPEGAYTGEVSGRMILDAGGSHVIVGHSERREVIGEDDDTVARKLGAALAAGLLPILCVGEKLKEREDGKAQDVVLEQLQSALAQRTVADMKRTVIAYEPVWAIGTGRTATAEDAVEMHSFIREYVGQRFGDDIAGRLRILYGGSVKPGNAGQLLAQEEIDGALVGGASLDPEAFVEIAAAWKEQ